MRSNNTSFPSSPLITGASWISPRYGPPRNQRGDILPTIWADDGNQYTMMDDGGTSEPAGKLWKQSLAQIVGTPPRISFAQVGDPDTPAPASFGEIKANRSLWTGPLGPYYSSGLVEADHVVFATQENDWPWGANGLFAGLAGIASSTDLGQHWTSAAKPSPAQLGNLNNFGPSNRYDPGFPLSWISRDGRRLWLKGAANFDGCAGLDCSAAYGFNYRQIQLTVAGQPAAKTANTQRKQKARTMFATGSDNRRNGRPLPQPYSGRRT